MKKLLTFGALFTAALTIGLGLSVIDAQAGSNPGGCQPTEYYLYCADEINLECIDPWAGDYTLYRCGGTSVNGPCDCERLDNCCSRLIP